jgi:hypothetical protein
MRGEVIDGFSAVPVKVKGSLRSTATASGMAALVAGAA